MKVVEVNNIDLPGCRFNGHDLQIMLNERGHDAKHFVFDKLGTNENTLKITKTEGGKFIQGMVIEFEKKLSLQSTIFPFGEIIGRSKEFREADVVHFHLIFNYFMSLYSFERLAQQKPIIWTLHDPWALTGHCVYPVDCKGWLDGCAKCPYLDRYAPLKEDNSHSIWKMKKEIYNHMNIDIVVASPWMQNLVKTSPLTSHFKRVHLIPFGVDLKLFKQRKNRKEIRSKLGIAPDSFVIMFRQDDQEWKGLPYIKDMLKKLNSKRPITILTVGRTGLLEELKEKYQIIEYEWITDNDVMVELYSAANLFLMPSVAEAFGLMAIESMACSLPIIVFEGTSLPSVTYAPECGISLNKGDTKAFVKTVKRLVDNPEECNERGLKGRVLAEKRYDVNRYNKEMLDLYEEVYARNKSKKKS